MPDEGTTDTDDTSTTDDATFTDESPETGTEDTTDWKAEARKWEGRAKDNSTAAARLKELEDAQKTTEERLTGTLDERTRERDEARRDLVRLRAAVKYGLDEDDLDLLGDGDEDVVFKRAERLAARPKVDAKRKTTNRTLGRTEEAKVDPDAWLRDAVRRR